MAPSANSLLLVLSLLFLLYTGSKVVAADEDGDRFLKECPATKCGGLEIRFPFRLSSGPRHCGVEGLVLSCFGNQARLALRRSQSFNVIAINYESMFLTIDVKGFWPRCPLRYLGSHGFSHQHYELYNSLSLSLFNCSKEFKPDSERDMIAGPIACLSGGDQFAYVVADDESMDKLPFDCTMVSTAGEIAAAYDDFATPFENKVESFFESPEATLSWRNFRSSVLDIVFQCRVFCEPAGKWCGFSKERNHTFCFNPSHHHGPDVALITGTSVSACFIIVVVASMLIYISRKADKDKETRLRVKRFLASYKTIKPARYSYADLKKITRRFKRKLGQGGFGSVYHGELINGIPVAVKMLQISKGDGDEFINEVATIGRIHHVNIVRLLGFCSEGTRRALIYEFMPNESLEKFIFLKDGDTTHRQFGMEKLLDIAIGIAQGIEYLHQGCDQRILHFDIKPHNILLDYDFNPKISDFGLAKLCSRDQSIVTMTAARGTMGYIAPEVYSRNFGTVSYKSDVYSFGMLLLEMVGGRKNVDPLVQNRSEIYFPEWIYERLVRGQNLRLSTELLNNEEEIVKKLVIVALWCIQWSPMERPTMTRVLHMLMGNMETLQLPPKPFVSSSDHEDITSFSQE